MEDVGALTSLRKAFARNKHEYRIVLSDDNSRYTNNEECAAIVAQNEGIRKIAAGTLLAMSDCALALVHAFIFAFTIVEMVSRRSWYDHWDILGSFTSLAYLAAFFAHVVLATIGIRKLTRELSLKSLTRCANCHASIFARQSNAQVSCPPAPSMAAAAASVEGTGRVRSEPGTAPVPASVNSSNSSGSPSMTGAYVDNNI